MWAKNLMLDVIQHLCEWGFVKEKTMRKTTDLYMSGVFEKFVICGTKEQQWGHFGETKNMGNRAQNATNFGLTISM